MSSVESSDFLPVDHPLLAGLTHDISGLRRLIDEYFTVQYALLQEIADHVERTSHTAEGETRRMRSVRLRERLLNCVQHAIDRETDLLYDIRSLADDFVDFEEGRETDAEAQPIVVDQPSPEARPIPDDQLNPGGWVLPRGSMPLGASVPPAAILPPAASLPPGAWAPPEALAHPGAWAPPEALAHPGAWAPPEALAHPGAWAPPEALAHPGAWAPPEALAQPGAWAPPEAPAQPGVQAPPVETPLGIWVAPLYQMAGFVQLGPAEPEPRPWPAHLQRLDPLPPPRLQPPPALLTPRPRAWPVLPMSETQIKSLQQTFVSQSPVPFTPPSQSDQTSEQPPPSEQNQQPAAVPNPWKIRSGPNCKCPSCLRRRSSSAANNNRL